MVRTKRGERIAVSHLTKTFGRVRAVDDLTFTVEPGGIAGFLGPNGAGKTTTLRALLGLIRADAGSATFDGRPYRALRSPNDDVGAVLDAGTFHPARSGRNHLRVYCTVNGYPVRRADEVLEMVGLAHAARRAVHGYSLGMRQRLALATALLGDPGVLVLDEPANGLDPHGIAWLRDVLRELAERGRTILVSSHVLAELQQFVDHFVIVNEGRLIRQGTLEEIADAQGRAVVVRTPQLDELLTVVRQHGGQVEATGPDSARVHRMTVDEVGQVAHREAIELRWLALEPVNLEAIFLALTEQPTPVVQEVR
jgi:ABC-2 type transport system ATP-binding protein